MLYPVLNTLILDFSFQVFGSKKKVQWKITETLLNKQNFLQETKFKIYSSLSIGIEVENSHLLPFDAHKSVNVCTFFRTERKINNKVLNSKLFFFEILC